MSKVAIGWAGPDHVSNEHLLHAPASVFTALAALFIRILRLHHVPSSFTSSLIIPLFKGGGKDPTLPNSYRGISLSSNMSKLFEKLLLDTLQNILLPLLQGGLDSPILHFIHPSFFMKRLLNANIAILHLILLYYMFRKLSIQPSR